MGKGILGLILFGMVVTGFGCQLARRCRPCDRSSIVIPLISVGFSRHKSFRI